jgi:hypothetical protein
MNFSFFRETISLLPLGDMVMLSPFKNNIDHNRLSPLVKSRAEERETRLPYFVVQMYSLCLLLTFGAFAPCALLSFYKHFGFE